jgi:hypothetical protein
MTVREAYSDPLVPAVIIVSRTRYNITYLTSILSVVYSSSMVIRRPLSGFVQSSNVENKLDSIMIDYSGHYLF